MKRPVFLLPVLLAVAALLASGCGAAAAHAATVNGEQISEDQIDEEISAIRDNKDYVNAIEQGSQGQVDVLGEAPKSLNSAFVANVLTRQIIYELVLQEVEDRDLDVPDRAVERAESDLESQINQAQPGLFEKFPEDYRDLISRWNASALILQGDLLGLPGAFEGFGQLYFEENPDEFEQSCTSHILVETRQEAQELRGQLLAGADFAALSREHSLDTGTKDRGGELPCLFPGAGIQPEYEEAAFSQPVGQPGEPVQTTFGWHVINVRARRTPQYQQVAQDVDDKVQQLSTERFNGWIQKALTDADVSINPRYGRWDAISAQVEPPGAPTTTVTEPPAGTGPPGSGPPATDAPVDSAPPANGG